MSRILIIGYGNPARQDDAVGWQAARQLKQCFQGDSEVEVIAAQQLTPEMADDLARCEFVIFLDARRGGRSGLIERTAFAEQTPSAGFTHNLTPAILLSLAEQLYGDAPEALGLTLTGWSFDLGPSISAGAQTRAKRNRQLQLFAAALPRPH